MIRFSRLFTSNKSTPTIIHVQNNLQKDIGMNEKIGINDRTLLLLWK
jgi:hypothetical protein